MHTIFPRGLIYGILFVSKNKPLITPLGGGGGGGVSVNLGDRMVQIWALEFCKSGR